MKVSAIKSYPVQDSDGRGYFIVKVETDAGIYGLGEIGIRNLSLIHISEPTRPY